MGEWVGSCRQWKQAGTHENAQAALTNAPEHRLCGAPVPVCLTDRVATETRECGVVGRATCGVTGRDDGRVGSIPHGAWSIRIRSHRHRRAHPVSDNPGTRRGRVERNSLNFRQRDMFQRGDNCTNSYVSCVVFDSLTYSGSCRLCAGSQHARHRCVPKLLREI